MADSREIRRRYCQRCDKEQALFGDDQARPCHGCGGTQFSNTPRKHASCFGWLLSDEDLTILRVNGIIEFHYLRRKHE